MREASASSAAHEGSAPPSARRGPLRTPSFAPARADASPTGAAAARPRAPGSPPARLFPASLPPTRAPRRPQRRAGTPPAPPAPASPPPARGVARGRPPCAAAGRRLYGWDNKFLRVLILSISNPIIIQTQNLQWGNDATRRQTLHIAWSRPHACSFGRRSSCGPRSESNPNAARGAADARLI